MHMLAGVMTPARQNEHDLQHELNKNPEQLMHERDHADLNENTNADASAEQACFTTNADASAERPVLTN
jgi:hypothetical protein